MEGDCGCDTVMARVEKDGEQTKGLIDVERKRQMKVYICGRDGGYYAHEKQGRREDDYVRGVLRPNPLGGDEDWEEHTVLRWRREVEDQLQCLADLARARLAS